MVEFLVPLNVTELLTAFFCHAFIGRTTTILTKNGSDMLGTTIYDEIIRFFYT